MRIATKLYLNFKTKHISPFYRILFYHRKGVNETAFEILLFFCLFLLVKKGLPPDYSCGDILICEAPCGRFLACGDQTFLFSTIPIVSGTLELFASPGC